MIWNHADTSDIRTIFRSPHFVWTQQLQRRTMTGKDTNIIQNVFITTESCCIQSTSPAVCRERGTESAALTAVRLPRRQLLQSPSCGRAVTAAVLQNPRPAAALFSSPGSCVRILRSTHSQICNPAAGAARPAVSAADTRGCCRVSRHGPALYCSNNTSALQWWSEHLHSPHVG